VSGTALQDAQRRILILAPTNKDAALTSDVFAQAGIGTHVCATAADLVAELPRGAGAVLLAEEILDNVGIAHLVAALHSQEPWSDLPLLLLTRHGADSDAALQALTALGNVTLLERPTRINALVSAARTALRARERQYQTRAYFAERDRINSALRESEQRYRAIVEQVREFAIFMLDPHGRATSWNEGVKRVLGYNEIEFLGLDVPAKVFAPEDVASGVPQRELRDAATKGAAGDDRWKMRKDGTRFWASGITTALRDPAGHLIGFTKIVRDLTDRKRAEEALKRADRRKDEFLATLAHELRNPLAPIRNSLNLLRITPNLDPSADRVYEMMERQVDHIVRLVDDLLEVSRITRGKIQLRKEHVEIAAIVRSAIETSNPIIDAGHHQLAVTLPPQPVLVDGDPVRLAQVVANLLNNAAKYTNPHGQIWLSARRQDESVCISVRDNGIGIPLEMQPYIFEMFTQVHRDSQRSQGGLGIGLTLVQSLVEMHGGSIEVRSAGAGQGSEFVVKLPALEERRHMSTSPGASPARGSVLSPQRVLVVDDNCDAARSLGMLLKYLGADVQVVHDGPAALRAVEEYRPSTVLLDLGMPKMDGYEVARRIRERAEFDQVTLIALTGWGQDDDRRRTRAAGFNHHLVKPADISSLQMLLSTPAANRDEND
jgi:PAS domain S-box-containing protein